MNFGLSEDHKTLNVLYYGSKPAGFAFERSKATLIETEHAANIYLRAFRKERRQILNSLSTAFVIKQQLYMPEFLREETTTSDDRELRPKWMPEDKLLIRQKGELPQVVKDDVSLAEYFDGAPRFTVDYLLEKLPKRAADGFEYGMLTLSTRQGEFNGWIASYNNDAGYPIGNIDGIAETALDAVLKLAIEMAKRTEI